MPSPTHSQPPLGAGEGGLVADRGRGLVDEGEFSLGGERTLTRAVDHAPTQIDQCLAAAADVERPVGHDHTHRKSRQRCRERAWHEQSVTAQSFNDGGTIAGKIPGVRGLVSDDQAESTTGSGGQERSDTRK